MQTAAIMASKIPRAPAGVEVKNDIENEGGKEGGAGVFDTAEQQFPARFLLMLAVGHGQAFKYILRVQHRPHLLRKNQSKANSNPARQRIQAAFGMALI